MKTPRQIMDSKISEAQWQKQVLDTLHLHQWTTFTIGDSRRANAGIPDIYAIRIPRTMWIECKTADGLLSKPKLVRTGFGKWNIRLGQEEVVAMLEKCPGVEVYVLRPQDWDRLQEIAKMETTKPEVDLKYGPYGPPTSVGDRKLKKENKNENMD